MLRRILLTTVLTLLAVGIAVGCWAYVGFKRDVDEQVEVSISDNSGRCPTDAILVTIKNGSWKTLNKVSWRIMGFEEGHSTVLADESYASDKIMQPDETQELCVGRPEEDAPVNPYRINPDIKWHFEVARQSVEA